MKPTGETSNALIQKDIGYIQKDIQEIKQGIKDLAGVYATKIFVDDAFKSLDLRLQRMEESSNLWRWLSPTLSAVLGSTVTFLLIQYIDRL